MFNLLAQKREVIGSKVAKLRDKELLPAVLYGPRVKNQAVQVNEKEFSEIFKEAGESSLIALKIGEESFQVLIHNIQKDPFTGKFLHIDFYQPLLTEETEASIPLIFEGEAPACKELGGTLVKNIQEVEVKALPQNLPREIKINIEKLKTFEDSILIKDLTIPKDVEILKDVEETVVLVTPIEDIEKDLEGSIEEKVDEVEKTEKKKKEDLKE
jgi:large subunit ribosomal protein L25